MNVKTRNQIRFITECAKLMNYRRDKILANLAVCAGIFVLGFQGSQITTAIAAMAFVQSVNLPEMVEAYQEAKRRRPPIQQDDPPRGKP